MNLFQLIEECAGPRGRANKMREAKDLLGIEKMKLQICQAAVDQYEGKTSFNPTLLDRSMHLVFPESYNARSSRNCGPCAEKNYIRLRSQIPTIREQIARLTPKGTKPSKDEVAKTDPEPVTEPAPAIYAGYNVFVVDGGFKSASVKAGVMMQRKAETMVVQLFDPFGAKPQEFAIDRVFVNMARAVNLASAIHSTPPEMEQARTENAERRKEAVSKPKEKKAKAKDAAKPSKRSSKKNAEQINAETETARAKAEAQVESKPENQSIQEPLPVAGDVIDNGTEIAKVVKIEGDTIHADGEEGPITIPIQEYHAKWVLS